MRLLHDVQLEQWQIDQILPLFYQELKAATYPDLGEEGFQSTPIPSIQICYILENSILNYIAEFAKESAREV